MSASAWAFVVTFCGCEAANAYEPTSSSRLFALGFPTSATLTCTVMTHGFDAEGEGGHTTVPVSGEPLTVGGGAFGSLYVRTCGKQALTEHRSTLWAVPP